MELPTRRILKVTYQPTAALKAHPGNARTHSKRQIRQIADSIKNFGFTNPILVDGNGTIIGGEGRWRAAKLLGMQQVPTIALEHMTADQIRALIVADNRLAQNAGWDKTILAIEFQHLLTVDNFDVKLTGFEVPEIDLILQNSSRKTESRDSLDLASGPAITAPCDLWQLGNHRVICGSSLQESTFSALMAKRQAHLVFIDPPNTVEIDSNSSKKGSIRDPEFSAASTEVRQAETVSLLTTCFRLLVQFSVAGSLHFTCADWRHMAEVLAAGSGIYDQLTDVCVWKTDKATAGPASLYRSQHQLFFVFRNGKERRGGMQLGRNRRRSNVWEYPTAPQQSTEKNPPRSSTTVKPVALVADALLDCSARGEVVLDPFLRGGSTLIAAERVGRVCYAIEVDPICVDTAIRRWQRYTGEHAIHTVTGKCFDELATQEQEAHNGARR